MTDSFYNTKEYKEKQSAITKENWKRGIFDRALDKKEVLQQ